MTNGIFDCGDLNLTDEYSKQTWEQIENQIIAKERLRLKEEVAKEVSDIFTPQRLNSENFWIIPNCDLEHLKREWGLK